MNQINFDYMLTIQQLFYNRQFQEKCLHVYAHKTKVTGSWKKQVQIEATSILFLTCAVLPLTGSSSWMGYIGYLF